MPINTYWVISSHFSTAYVTFAAVEDYAKLASTYGRIRAATRRNHDANIQRCNFRYVNN